MAPSYKCHGWRTWQKKPAHVMAADKHKLFVTGCLKERCHQSAAKDQKYSPNSHSQDPFHPSLPHSLVDTSAMDSPTCEGRALVSQLALCKSLNPAKMTMHLTHNKYAVFATLSEFGHSVQHFCLSTYVVFTLGF